MAPLCTMTLTLTLFAAVVFALPGDPLGRLTASSVQIQRMEAFHCVGCNLQHVDLNAFTGLHDLKVIDLSNNDIVGLTVAHFTDSAALQRLDLTGNPRVDCMTLRSGLSGVEVICDSRPRGRRQAEGAVTSTEGAVTSTEGAVTNARRLRPEVWGECTSNAWKVVSIVFIVLIALGFLGCLLLAYCCKFCRCKDRNVKRTPGGDTVYELTTSDLEIKIT